MKAVFTLVAAATIAAVGMPTYAADTLSQVTANNKITVAYRESSIPFSYLAGSSKPIGFAVDITNAIVDAVKK